MPQQTQTLEASLYEQEIQEDLSCKNPDHWADGVTYTLKLIPHNMKNAEGLWFKYIPQIKASCAKCGAYIKFVKQTDDLITRINEKLAKEPLTEYV